MPPSSALIGRCLTTDPHNKTSGLESLPLHFLHQSVAMDAPPSSRIDQWKQVLLPSCVTTRLLFPTQTNHEKEAFYGLPLCLKRTNAGFCLLSPAPSRAGFFRPSPSLPGTRLRLKNPRAVPCGGCTNHFSNSPSSTSKRQCYWRSNSELTNGKGNSGAA